jgi:signal transduction histidine kinase
MTEPPEAPRSTADSRTGAASLDAAQTHADVAETQAEAAGTHPDAAGTGLVTAETQADAAGTQADAAGARPDAEKSRADAGGGVVVVTNGQRGPAGTRPAGPAGAGPERMRAATGRFSGGWPLGRIIGVGVLIAALFSLLAIIVGGVALADLASARSRVVDTLDPAALHASQLEVALLNQETGVRGYALSGQPGFLRPYYAGLKQQSTHINALRPLLSSVPGGQADLAQVITRINAWRATYAGPTIQHVTTSGPPVVKSAVAQGKKDFDALRATLGRLQGKLVSERGLAVASLDHSAAVLNATLIGCAFLLLVVVIVFALGLWRSAILPLSRLAADARQVAGGDFEHRLDSPGGPVEVREVGRDVDLMRERILAELSAVRAANATLEARTADLQRSNSELEQFAYVASHDLQEPLRKVASFCQLLQRRYAGRLDAKADEYIDHAVDGAKRMQALINDLLAFSRVGRTAQHREPVNCGLLLAQAWANLAAEVRRTRATIEQGQLPTVQGEASLLTAVFQNLLSNALKFRGDLPPRISVSASREGRDWLFSFSDNGIGIDPQYADRIFVIFQRLHDRATYPGTGIGLAMVKKIIEYHGGRIWLDETATSGTRFCFTLPVLPEDESADD